MVDPTLIADGLDSLDAYQTATFDPVTTDVTTDLNAYAVSTHACMRCCNV